VESFFKLPAIFALSDIALSISLSLCKRERRASKEKNNLGVNKDDSMPIFCFEAAITHGRKVNPVTDCVFARP
jgi:hypothetical protein